LQDRSAAKRKAAVAPLSAKAGRGNVVGGAVMAETLDKMSEQLTRLEVTVAGGFHEVKSRFHDAELRDSALSRKIDVNTESLCSDLRTVLDAVASLGDEMRRTTDAIRREIPARVTRRLASLST
jgi:hypothetical protein